MRFLATNIGDCPHTEGLFKAARIAKMGGLETFICKPNSSLDEILSNIKNFNPDFLGFSYRLSPEKGIVEFEKIYNLLNINGLLQKADGSKRKIAFAGLPETLNIIKAKQHNYSNSIFQIPQLSQPIAQLQIVFDYFEFNNKIRDKILIELKDELFPPSIKMLDELADYVIENDNYLSIPELPTPGNKAKKSLIIRMQESDYPLIRSHFGIPSESIEPTVEGIRELAKAQCIDEVSIGSSDLSQRYYGQPEEFKKRKNDGGVPYKDINDLKKLFDASRTGNFPACKPYAHTTGILNFIDDCIDVGMLIGAHQAIPLFWFNQLDGRGSTTVKESIREHILAVRKLAKLNIPVEMNDPNQWSSRWAHDTVVVADYGLISAVMLENDVENIFLQMQFNKPVETSDFADIAKMKVASENAYKMRELSGRNAAIHHETRTGIEYFSTDLKLAKWQLARSTLLQMFLNPAMIHLVSYCEANRIAMVEDIKESSKIIRKAVDVFRINKPDLIGYTNDPLVLERQDFLKKESDYLLSRIAMLDENYDKKIAITKFLSNPDTIYKSLQKKYMTAPGIIHPEYAPDNLLTRPMKNGFFNAVNTKGQLITEEERLFSFK